MTFIFCPLCTATLVQAEVAGMTRVYCEEAGCGFVHYENPTPVVAAIVQRDEDVILVRSHGWPADWFGLVTEITAVEAQSKNEVLLKHH